MPFCSPRSHTVKKNNPDTFVRLQVCFCYRLSSRAYRFWESKTESQVCLALKNASKQGSPRSAPPTQTQRPVYCVTVIGVMPPK